MQAAVGETWPHPYAVVTDGHLFIGLHGRDMPSPSLTFVLPELRLGVGRLKERGVTFEEERFGDDVFNQAQLRDPGGLSVMLLEARTFSPPQFDAPIESACGYFSELGMPARTDDAAAPSGNRSASSRSKSRPSRFRGRRWSRRARPGAVSHPRAAPAGLTFEDSDMPQRLARLRERGVQVSDEMPDTLDEADNGVLVAPEGTRLLLLTAAD